MYSSDGLGEILAVKVGTTGLPGREREVLPNGLQKSIESGIFRYLASSPVCCGDDTRHKSQSKQAKDSRSGGPPAPVPNGAGSKCHHLHLYTAAQHDRKISNIVLARGPQKSWNTSRDTSKALYRFLDTIKPLTGLVEAMFRALVPEIWDIYDQVYRVLPIQNTTAEVKKSFVIWASRAIVLNTHTDIHLDFKDVCRGFCAVVPFRKYTGGNICLPTLGISIPLAAGMLVSTIYSISFTS